MGTPLPPVSSTRGYSSGNGSRRAFASAFASPVDEIAVSGSVAATRR
jgi:hypothetical protein